MEEEAADPGAGEGSQVEGTQACCFRFKNPLYAIEDGKVNGVDL